MESLCHLRNQEQSESREKQNSEMFEIARNMSLPEVSDENLQPVSKTVILNSKADTTESSVHGQEKKVMSPAVVTLPTPDNSGIGESQPSKPSPEHHGCNEDSSKPLDLSTTWTGKDEANICQPFNYLTALPGKSFRSQLLSALNVWFQVDDESYEVIEMVIGMLHNASLLVDDIQDDSVLRRGSPAAHCLFGVAQTINTANYVYFIAQKELLRLPDPFEASRVFNEEMINLHRGQGLELFWRDTMTVPSEEEYIKMVSNKTGGLIRLATRLLQSASSTKHKLMPLAELIGRIYQIRDDYNNLCSDKMAAAKGQCEDITEGKFSFPVVHAIQSGPSRNNAILNILRLRTSDPALKEYVVWYLRTQSRSLQYTLDILNGLLGHARLILGKIDGKNATMERLIGALESGLTTS